jgi:hypothetical protein
MNVPMIERAVEIFMNTANQTTPREMIQLRAEMKRVIEAPDPEQVYTCVDCGSAEPWNCTHEGHIE